MIVARSPRRQPEVGSSSSGRTRPDGTSPFASGEIPRGAQFVEPRLVCELEFTEWTSRTAQLRHPSFKGLREDRDARQVVREG